MASTTGPMQQPGHRMHTGSRGGEDDALHCASPCRRLQGVPRSLRICTHDLLKGVSHCWLPILALACDAAAKHRMRAGMLCLNCTVY